MFFHGILLNAFPLVYLFIHCSSILYSVDAPLAHAIIPAHILNDLIMSSLDRLIALSKRTGDRLIVHDPYGGRDVVIMDVEQYKHLIDGRHGVADMDENEFIDRLHRDIAVWQSNQDEEFGMGAFESNDMALDGGYSDDSWESIGDIMLESQPFDGDDVYSKSPEAAAPAVPEKVYQPLESSAERNREDMSDLLYEFPEPTAIEETPSWNMHAAPSLPVEPSVTESPAASVDTFQAPEPLNEEPVFFEEPI